MESLENKNIKKEILSLDVDLNSLPNEIKEKYEEAKKINDIEKTKSHKLFREAHYFVIMEDEEEDDEVMDLNLEFNFSREGIDVTKLKNCLNKLIKHFSIFGLVFSKIKEYNYIQTYKPELIKEINEENIDDNDIIKIREELKKNKFTIFDNLLYKIKLYVSSTQIYLFFLFHHSIVDGNSIKVLYNSLRCLYEDKEIISDLYFYLVHKDETSQLDPKRIPEMKSYYKQFIYGGKPDTLLKADKIENISKAKRNNLRFDWTDLYKKLVEILNKSGHKINMILIMGLLIAICIYNKSDKSFIYTEHNGRYGKIEKFAVGNFLKYYMFRHDFKKKEKLIDFYNEIEFQKEKQKILPHIYRFVPMDDHGEQYICLNNRFTLFEFGNFHGNTVKSRQFYYNYENIEPNEFTALNIEIDIINDEMEFIVEYDISQFKEDSINKFQEIFEKSTEFLVNNWNNKNEINLIESVI